MHLRLPLLEAVDRLYPIHHVSILILKITNDCRAIALIYENVTDCMRKKPKRTLALFKTLPIFLSFYAIHTFLPSFQTARALTLLNFNFTMSVIVLDLML